MYQWDPDDYQKNSFYQRNCGVELLSRLKFRGDERVLDVGCGDGELTFLIAREASQGFVVGIDDSGTMIELANNRYPSDQYKNLIFMERDITKLDFDEEFDVIFSNFYLHWKADHLSILKKLGKSLKSEGVILL